MNNDSVRSIRCTLSRLDQFVDIMMLRVHYCVNIHARRAFLAPPPPPSRHVPMASARRLFIDTIRTTIAIPGSFRTRSTGCPVTDRIGFLTSVSFDRPRAGPRPDPRGTGQRSGWWGRCLEARAVRSSTDRTVEFNRPIVVFDLTNIPDEHDSQPRPMLMFDEVRGTLIGKHVRRLLRC